VPPFGQPVVALNWNVRWLVPIPNVVDLDLVDRVRVKCVIVRAAAWLLQPLVIRQKSDVLTAPRFITPEHVEVRAIDLRYLGLMPGASRWLEARLGPALSANMPTSTLANPCFRTSASALYPQPPMTDELRGVVGRPNRLGMYSDYGRRLRAGRATTLVHGSGTYPGVGVRHL